MRGAGAAAVVLAGGGRLPPPNLTSPERRRSSVSLLPLQVGPNRNQVELFFPREGVERSFLVPQTVPKYVQGCISKDLELSVKGACELGSNIEISPVITDLFDALQKKAR